MRAFWMIMISMAIYSYCTQTYHVHLLSHLRFTGFSAATAALIQTVHGILQVGGRLGVGWLADRIGRANLMRLAQVFLGFGWASVALISPDRAWFALPLYFLFFGFGQAAYTVSSQTIVADFFGTRRFATIRGLLNPVSVLGSVVGPVVAGLSKDRLGSLSWAFLSLAPLIWLATVTLGMAGKPKMAHEDAKT